MSSKASQKKYSNNTFRYLYLEAALKVGEVNSDCPAPDYFSNKGLSLDST